MTDSSWPGSPGGPGEGAPGDPNAYPGGGYPPGPAPAAGPGEPGMATAGWGPGETLSTEPAKSRRGLVLGAAATVLAVAAGAGIYVATQLSGGGLQPEGLAPASTFAFAKIDLDPAANQKLAARSFADNFPSAPKSDAENVFETFVAEALKSDEELDYDRDVKPWLGKRVGIAAFSNAAGEPTAVGIIQSKDDGKAREAMDRVAAQARTEGEDFAYRLARGYVIVADDAGTADAVATTPSDQTLADNDQFDGDVDTLTGDQVVVGWVDVKKAFDVARRAEPQLGLVPNALTSQLQGRVVMGAHFADDYVEVEGFGIGMQAQTENVTNSEQSLLKNLPADTVAAVSVNNLDKSLDESLGSFLAAGLGTEVDQVFAEIEQATGLRVREDVLPALGKQTVLALGAFDPSFAALKAGLVATVQDAANAREVGQKLQATAGQFGVPLESTVQGNTFYLTFGPGYQAKLRSEKGLGDTALFKQTMGDLGDDVAAAFYVDISRIVDQFPAEAAPRDVQAIKAVGTSFGMRGDRSYFRLRFVAGGE